MSDTLKPCPHCWSDAFYRAMGEAMNKAASDGVDIGFPNGFRAGIEAAARIAEAALMVANTPTANRQRYTRNLVSAVVEAIRALPTPSTLPQEGGELSKGETE